PRCRTAPFCRHKPRKGRRRAEPVRVSGAAEMDLRPCLAENRPGRIVRFCQLFSTACRAVYACKGNSTRRSSDMPIDLLRVQSVFRAAVELPPSERAAVLEQECGADAELRRRV